MANLADDSAARAKIVSIGAIKSLVSVIDASNEGVDEAGGDEVTNAARKCFELIDKKGEGFLSTAEIFTAVKTDEDVIRFLRNCGEENLQILLQPTRLKKSLDEYGFWGMDWNDWVQEIQQGVLKLAEEHALAKIDLDSVRLTLFQILFENSYFFANRQQKQTPKVGQLRTFEYFEYMNEFSDSSLKAFNDGKSFFRPDLCNSAIFIWI